MRALIVTSTALSPNANSGAGSAARLQSTLSQLQAFGITYRRARVESLSAGAIASLADAYDFVLIPLTTTNLVFATLIDTSPIPVFITHGESNAAGYGALPGVTGTRSGLVDRFCGAVYSNSPYVCHNARFWELDGGTSLLTVSALDPLTGSAQTNAGETCCWSTTTSAGQKLYVSGVNPVIQPIFGLLLEHAVRDGALSKPPRKAPLFLDLDHINGAFMQADLSIIDKIISDVGSGVTWGGQQNDNETNFENMSPVAAAAIASMRAAGRVKLCYHSHRSSGAEQPTAGTWPAFTTQVTKQEQADIYDSDQAVMEGHGLGYDIPGHYNSGSNNWDEATLELFSQDRSLMSDPAEEATQAGYGFLSFRMGTGRQATRAAPNNKALYDNQLHRRRVMRGIQLFSTNDLYSNTLIPFDTAAKWRDWLRQLWESVAYAQVGHLHDEDYDGSDEDGEEVLAIIRDLAAHLGNVIVPYADPTHYVMPRHSGGVDGVQY